MDRSREPLGAGREDHTIDGRHVGIVAADCQHDMDVAGQNIVGRIEPNPARVLTSPGQRPGVHGISALQPLLIGRLHGPQVAADIGDRQAERPHVRGLDKNAYILPGLGAAGDRAYGTK